MALSLDYIGKFLIVMVTVSVAVTLIINFRGDVEVGVPWGNDEESGVQIVEMDSGNEETELKVLIDNCVDQSIRNPESSFECYLVMHVDGGFDGSISLDADDWEEVEKVPDDFEDKTNLMIEHSLPDGGVVVEIIS